MTLSPREIQLLGYVANGYRSKEIARILSLKSARDVQNRLNSIYRKLGIQGQPNPRVKAATWYVKNGKAQNDI